MRVHAADEVLSASQRHHSNIANRATSLSHAANEWSVAESLDDPHTTPLGFTILLHDCRDADIPQKSFGGSQTQRCTFNAKCPDFCLPRHRYLEIFPAGIGEEFSTKAAAVVHHKSSTDLSSLPWHRRAYMRFVMRRKKQQTILSLEPVAIFEGNC